MPHPPYIPDLAQWDYHLLRSLQNHCNDKAFDSNQAAKNELHQFPTSKTKASSNVEFFSLPKDGERLSNKIVRESLTNVCC